MNIKDISVVVQGPIDDRTYETIEVYQNFGEIIISCWNNDNPSLLDKSKNKNYILVTSHYPDSSTKYNNQGYRLYRAITTLAGINKSTKPFILKTRSDELYPNLDAMLAKWHKDPNKIHTTNNGFWKNIPFCMSGHIFLSKKEDMQYVMEQSIENCYYRDHYSFRCSEQQLAFYYMKYRDIELTIRNWRQHLKEHVTITSCDLLPGHLHSGGSSSGNKKLTFVRKSNYPKGTNDHNINMLYNHENEI